MNDPRLITRERDAMMHLLCVGDIHLGKRVSGIPSDLQDGPFAPADAWRRTVDYACQTLPDAVLLAGDVVEQEDDFFEAYGDLSAGVQRLRNAGIDVLGVAGNHDVDVLPRLANAIPDFHLLGAGGRWERCALRTAEGERVDICGWSFPNREYKTSPLDLPFPEHDPNSPPHSTVGLLHCDLDQTHSRYAPVRSSALNAAPVDAWFLGHVHKPSALTGIRPSGYLGSLLGLDIGEMGPHGPWWVDIEPGRIAAHHLPLAPLRWEVLEVELDPTVAVAEIPERVVSALHHLHQKLVAESHQASLVGCRVYLTGQHQDGIALQRWLNTSEPHTLRAEYDGVQYFIARISVRSQPHIDIETLAKGFDPAALLARKIQILRCPDSTPALALIAQARQRFNGIEQRPVFASLTTTSLNDAEIAQQLERVCLDLLEQMLALVKEP